MGWLLPKNCVCALKSSSTDESWVRYDFDVNESFPQTQGVRVVS